MDGSTRQPGGATPGSESRVSDPKPSPFIMTRSSAYALTRFATGLGWMQKQRHSDVAIKRQPLEYYLRLDYPYTVVPDNGAWFIEFPDLPGCMTQVRDASEIPQAAEEIRTLWIEGEYEDGATIPEPAMQSEYSGKFVVRLPKSLHRGLAERARREGMSLNAWVNYLLAERNLAAEMKARLDAVLSREPVEAR